MIWLQSGPFLEISFLLTLDLGRPSFVNRILTKLKSFKPTVEHVATEAELKEKINEFNIGYPFDDKDPNSKVLHQIEIPVYVEIDVKRKSVLSLRQVSGKLVAVDFWFYGSESDAPEWNQVGITEKQLPIFKDLLFKLFDTFDFVLGTVAYENSVTDLFDIAVGWPDEKYKIENISRQLLQSDNYFLLIIANKKHIDIQEISGTRTIGYRQTLEKEKYSA
jgi:hypothetical protein